MPINQIGDDGAVIGYKPKLEYKKSINGTASTENATPDNKNTDYSGEIEYSSTLSAFSEALPSTTLTAIDASIKLLDRLVTNLKDKYVQGNWGEFSDISALISAIKGESKEFANNFVNFHSQNIGASIIPELIMHLAETEERLTTLSSVIKNMFYGNVNITTEDAYEIDNALVSQLKHLEAIQDLAKVNYYTLAMDSTLNRSIATYTYSINKECMKLAGVINKTESSNVDMQQMKLVQKMYDEVKSELQDRKSWYDSQQSIEIMQKTLYNYYIKRAETVELYGLFDGNHENFMIGRKLTERQRRVDDALLNVSRILGGHAYYVSEITKMEQEKVFLMNIYSQLNYNAVNS